MFATRLNPKPRTARLTKPPLTSPRISSLHWLLQPHAAEMGFLSFISSSSEDFSDGILYDELLNLANVGTSQIRRLREYSTSLKSDLSNRPS